MTSAAQLARKLRDALEPTIGSVYFAPECHEGYAALGFPSSPATSGGVALPDGVAYFVSRGSCLGQAPGQLVAAAFGVFNPEMVTPLVTAGWQIADAPTLARVRRSGAVAQLQRILGKPAELDEMGDLAERATQGLSPLGRPLFAGLLSLDPPGDAWERFFVFGDQLREFRGDSHTAAWTAAGLDATEIGLLTELFWGLPPRTYIRSRAWTDDQINGAQARLEARGWLNSDGTMTDEGQAGREAVEQSTDLQCVPIIENLGDDAERFIETVGGWSRSVVDAHGYPNSAAQITRRD